MSATSPWPSAAIVSWREYLYFVPQYIGESGLTTDGEPITTLEQSASSADLGKAVVAALAQFGCSASLPPTAHAADELSRKKRKRDPLLATTGASSWTALWKEAAVVSCSEATPGTLSFHASTKGPSRGQYQFKRDPVVISKASAPGLIGDAVRQALARCD
jgi:hypothetical protein